jgi:hypothetical protein
MNRRKFLQLAAATPVAALAVPRLFADNNLVPVRLVLRPDRLGNRIAPDFTGLSYESAQLGNPNFFAGDNAGLIGFVQRLGKQGILRIGGNTSEYCYWTPDSDKKPATPLPGGVVDPDKGHKAPPPVNITPQAILNLKDFLDATGWNLIHGLNMGTGTAEAAAAEAAYVMDVIGTRVIAFQLCNEPDLFSKNGIRKPDYAFDQYSEEWRHFYDTIKAKTPSAPFAGPDTAFNNTWLAPFARKFKKEVRFISQHYYAEGPPTDPSMTIERLLSPNPKLEDEFKGMRETVKETGLPFRLAETNSCYSAGKAGVSDTFAASLWGADLMYQLAFEGGMGINFHGGGYGWYTPIAGTRDTGFLARPIYYGMLLFAEAGPGQLVEVDAQGVDQAPLLMAYGIKSDSGALRTAIFNKNGDGKVRLTLDPGQAAARAKLLWLRAPRIDDATDVTFGGAPVGANGAWVAAREDIVSPQNGLFVLDLPAASGLLVTFEA